MSDDRHERTTPRSLAELGSEADDLIQDPGPVSEPSVEFEAWLDGSTANGLEHVTDPPKLELRDTERPPASTVPSPGPEPSERDVIQAALARLEQTSIDTKRAIELAKEVAALCFEQIIEVKQILALLPCMKDEPVRPVCPLPVPAE